MEGICATGDIWSTGAFSFESPFKDLLDRGSYTLEELLAEDELLQELRGMHHELINFFSTEEAVVRLIQYATKMHPEKPVLMNGNGCVTPPEETTKEEKDNPIPEEETTTREEGKQKKPGQWLFPPMEKPSGSFEKTPEEQEELENIRYPYMACEVICCEINAIIDILVDRHVPTSPSVKGHVEQDNETAVEVTTKDPPSILDLLFSFLTETNVGELDDYRAGYFDKILSVLFRKRPKAMSTYVNDGGVPLMTAMMNHLYSHSIMQIVQRLLMPPPSSFLNEETDDQDEQDDNLNSLFQCQWSELPESIELLLDSLTVSNANEDLQLSKSQNASEVLITVIQNSPLTSPTLLVLTTDPIMGRIMKAACTLEDGADFSPHDSTLTCAMNVLESIVLQLGGYGSVGTALETAPEDEEETDEKPQEDTLVNGDDASIELEVSKMLKSAQEVANADTLILHLPDLLKSLCGLLRHPSTSTWQSPMQFAKNEKQALLGMSRLRIVRLIESLVLLGNPKVDAILCESDCLAICLDLFWEFQWCSMLHQSVANLLVHVFEGANERAELQEYFLVKCNLLRRLMDSFEDPEETKEAKDGDTLNDAVMALRRLHLKNRSVSVQSERGSSIGSIGAALGEDVIPVSDDDVDAALEQQGDSELQALEKPGDEEETARKFATNAVVKAEQTANEVAEVKSSIPSLRMGCLGHVIIICQALVHACTANMHESHEDVMEQQDDANQSTLMRSIDLGESAPVSRSEDRTSDADSTKDENKGEVLVAETSENAQAEEDDGVDKDGSVQAERSDSEGSVSNDLIIAQLVKTNPLHGEWNHFITSTLAAETAIQSTPLGGTNAATVESMQSQLPVARCVRSYDFTGDDGDDLADINARGFLGGEVLDMDDNDLDIAASMMEALNMARPRESGDGDDDNSDEGQEGITTSFGTVVKNSSTGSGDYLFDDPLGGNARFGGSFCSQDDSSDEEEEPGESAADIDHPIVSNSSGDSEDDAPVMDLFTGNFDDKASPENAPFSNFANFDDAFAAAGAIETPIFSSGDEDNVFKISPATFQVTGATEDETDIFGTTPPHSLLLADEDTESAGLRESTTAEVSVDSSGDAEADADAESVGAEMLSEGNTPSETPVKKTEVDTKEDSATEM